MGLCIDINQMCQGTAKWLMTELPANEPHKHTSFQVELLEARS